MARIPKQQTLIETVLHPDHDALLRRLYQSGGGRDFGDNWQPMQYLTAHGYVGKATKVNYSTYWYVTQKGAAYCQLTPVQHEMMAVVNKAHAAHHDPAQICAPDCPLCQVERIEEEGE